MSVISIREVSKSFDGNTIFDKASLELEQGQTYGLTGPNGSGKSVLLKMMCGFMAPDAGEVVVAPEFLSAGRTFPDRFGITIDGPAYLPGKSAAANLKDLAAIRQQVGVEEINDILLKVGLDPSSRKRVRNFSLGMKQKLSLAQALMEKPDVLLLDEPFNALDAESVIRIKGVLEEQKDRGTTILFTSHSQQDIDDLCDVVLALEDGKLKVR
jgi:ABC-2 type transport system ATP-binding protein